MKLIIDFNNDENDIFLSNYDMNCIVLTCNGKASAEQLLNSKNYFDIIYRCSWQKAREKHTEGISRSELKELHDINNFKEILISFSDDFDIKNATNLLEGIRIPIVFDSENTSFEQLTQLNKLNYYFEPKVKSNQNPIANVSLTAYIATINKTIEIKDSIQNCNLDSWGKLMLLYDTLKKRIYKIADSKDDYSAGRDLTSVLEKDEIVCLGFANLFSKVSSELGIKSFVKIYSNIDKAKPGHATSVCVIDGRMYEFDLTMDCKKKVNDDETNRYHGFGMSYQGAVNFYRKRNDLISNESLFDEVLSAYDLYQSSATQEDSKSIIKICCIRNFLAKLKDFYYFIGDELALQNIENLITANQENALSEKQVQILLKSFFDTTKYPINVETFVKTFCRVRTIEFSREPNYYRISSKVIDEVLNQKINKLDKLGAKLFPIDKEKLINQGIGDNPHIRKLIK